MNRLILESFVFTRPGGGSIFIRMAQMTGQMRFVVLRESSGTTESRPFWINGSF
jgi:hypothetical protein